MSQSIRERLEYHPAPGVGTSRGAMRRVDRRLAAITRLVDVTGKDVLDLGCSGGYFSFALARDARRVFAIDGDQAVIDRNREAAERMGVTNVEFVHAVIRPELIEALPSVDVTLFLSVFHHLLTGSEAYDWNDATVVKTAFRSLELLKARTDILVFEMGYPDEGYEWCSRLPRMMPSPRDWIVDRVFGADFPSVQIVESPSYAGSAAIRRRFHRVARTTTLWGRLMRRMLTIDPRDGRDIFIGSKASAPA